MNNFTYDIEAEIMNNNPNMNPNLNFLVDITDGNGNRLGKNFILYDWNKHDYLNRTREGFYEINKRLSDIQLILAYNCSDDKNCTLKNEDKDRESIYALSLMYEVPNITHQSIYSPIDETHKINRSLLIYSSFYSLHISSLYLEKTIYKEDSTLFDRFWKKEEEYESWDIGDRETYAFDALDNKIFEEKNNFYIELLQVVTYNRHTSYVLYKRKRLTILDTFVKLASLFPTFYKIFQFIFNYYSKNFNNHKIIEKVLQMNNEDYRQIKLNYIYQNEILNNENKTNKDFDENIDNINIINDSRKESLIQIENGAEINNEEDELLSIKKMPKFSFIQFYFNNLYCKCCCNKFRKQEFLYVCNQIMLKYLSIDSILYYQMKLENILKDYKWNNSILNNIEKNLLIKKLKII